METIDDLAAYFSGPRTPVEELVEKATDEFQFVPDWGLNMQIVDLINEDTAEVGLAAVRALRRKLGSTDVGVQLLTLTVLETCVKNCHPYLHSIIAERALLPEMERLARESQGSEVCDKALQLIQEWAEALTQPAYRASVAALQAEGFRFPGRDLDHNVPIFTPPPSARLTGLPVQVVEEEGAGGPVMVARAVPGPLHEAEPSLPPVQAIPVVFADPLAQPPSATSGEDEAAPAEDSGAHEGHKVWEELAVARGQVDLLLEILSALDPPAEPATTSSSSSSSSSPSPAPQPDTSTLDVALDLARQCEQMQGQLVRVIDAAEAEDLLAAALALNDDMARALHLLDALRRRHPALHPPDAAGAGAAAEAAAAPRPPSPTAGISTAQYTLPGEGSAAAEEEEEEPIFGGVLIDLQGRSRSSSAEEHSASPYTVSGEGRGAAAHDPYASTTELPPVPTTSPGPIIVPEPAIARGKDPSTSSAMGSGAGVSENQFRALVAGGRAGASAGTEDLAPLLGGGGRQLADDDCLEDVDLDDSTFAPLKSGLGKSDAINASGDSLFGKDYKF